jgi:DMSO/TMAO reductase YedYZ heme-binding membrane subunit
MTASPSVLVGALRSIFIIHDSLSSFLVRHLFVTKKVLLVVAHFSLLGFLFPEIRRDFGVIAGNLLICILFLSPLAKITRMRLLNQLMSLRRELGITMAYLAIVHGVGYMIDPAWAAILSTEIAYFYGVLALFLTLPLLFTSNNLAQKYLGPYWKKIHRLVYVIFIFVILHRFLQRGDTASLIQAGVLIGSYVLLKLYAWKPFWPALNGLMQKIGLLYQAFSLEKRQGL